jgi:hypothetical protein
LCRGLKGRRNDAESGGNCCNIAVSLIDPEGQLSSRQAYIFGVDAFTEQRVLKLKNEIASLQYENESYRSQRHHTLEEKHSDDLRRVRLLAIREELRTLLQPKSNA